MRNLVSPDLIAWLTFTYLSQTNLHIPGGGVVPGRTHSRGRASTEKPCGELQSTGGARWIQRRGRSGPDSAGQEKTPHTKNVKQASPVNWEEVPHSRPRKKGKPQEPSPTERSSSPSYLVAWEEGGYIVKKNSGTGSKTLLKKSHRIQRHK